MDDESFLKERLLPGQEDILGSNPTARTSAVGTLQTTSSCVHLFFMSVHDDVQLNKIHNKSLKTRTNWPRQVRELILDSNSWSKGVKGQAFRVPGGQGQAFRVPRGQG